MASLNKVMLIGNLTRAPELRYTPGGAAVCEFGLAMNRKFTGSNGQEQTEACFVDIVVWSKAAENCGRYLEKGSLVFIEGRLQFEQWQERDTGAKRSKLKIVAERVQFLSGTPRQGGGEDQGGYGDEDGGGYQQPQQGGGFQQRYPQERAQQPQQPQARPQYQQQAPQQQQQQQRYAAPPRQSQQPQSPPPAQPQPPPMPEGAFDVENAEDDIPF